MSKQRSGLLWALAVALLAGIVIGAWWRVAFDALTEYWRLPAVVVALALYVWGEWRKSKKGGINQKRMVST